jgi:4'-phosphopantetheinyl transferase EntD
MLSGLFPADVATAHGDSSDPSAPFFPGEEELVKNAVLKRKLEFANGRACARAALAHFGVTPQPLLALPSRELRWPMGFIGSVTHTSRLCAAAAGRASDYDGLGLDAEPALPLPENLLSRVCSVDELEAAETFHVLSPHVCARLIFSAKEAAYKCQFPSSGAFLGFDDVAIELSEQGTFVAHVLPALSGLAGREQLPGHWLCRNGFLLTAVWLRSRSAARG